MSAGVYIWQGLKPCFKILFTIGCGYALTKKGLFPPAASKGLSQVAMNIGLPCLLFSSMVPSYDSSNISNFGPLCLVAIVFQFIGLVMALIIRELFYVPADFQWGILLLGALSNWGNFSTAVVQSVATEAPFNPATDVELGIAYIAVFIMIMNITLYGSGLYRVCGWDFDPNNEETPRTLSGRLARRKRQFSNLTRWMSSKKYNLGSKRASSGTSLPPKSEGHTLSTAVPDPSRVKKVARRAQKLTPTFPGLQQTPSGRIDIESQQAIDMPDPAEPAIAPVTERRPVARSLSRVSAKSSVAAERDNTEGKDLDEEQQEMEEAHEHPKTTIVRSMLKATRGLMTPATLGVIISLPFALINPLKALMVPVDGWSGTKIKNAPDGAPPLAFFFDFTQFVGAMMIPGGLIVLGASFARIKISRSKIREMPLAAIAASTFAKLVLMPVIGMFTVIGFRNTTTLFPAKEKMLSFVPLLLSGAPSAVNQLVITQIFLKEGESLDTLATFLLAQYILLLIQSAGTTAISLWVVS